MNAYTASLRSIAMRERKNERPELAGVIDGAADEIERARRDLTEAQAEATRLRGFNEGLAKNVADLEAQVEQLKAALEPFAEIGQWLFARPEIPDDQPVVELPGINHYQVVLTRGHFKEAHRLADCVEQHAAKEG